MIALIQRVKGASVVVGEETVSSIRKGLLVFLGMEKEDTQKDIDYIVRKASRIRILEDESGRLNYPVMGRFLNPMIIKTGFCDLR